MLVGEISTVSKVVRVAVSNNFNCSKEEFSLLDSFQTKHPSNYFFVNCNINTPNLKALNDHDYQAVITINPNLNISQKEINKLYLVRKDRVSFVRVKYLPGRPAINALVNRLANEGYKVVLTLQRFNGFKNLDKYSSREHYHFSCNRMRLSSEALKDVDALVNSHPNIYACDRSGQGCSGCGLCASLTYGSADVGIASLNLSASGHCQFNCPDCYAKTLQLFLQKCNTNDIKYDVIKKNKKQLGSTKHAQLALQQTK